MNDTHQFEQLDLPVDEITVRTLFVHGTEDSSVPFGQSETLAKTISGAEFEAIDGADHMMPLTHAEELDARIKAFIDGD